MKPGSALSNIRGALRYKGQVLSARRARHDLEGWLIDCINRAVSHHRLAHGNGFIPDGLIFARLAQPNESGQKQVLAYSVRRRSRCGFPGQFSGFLVIAIGSRLVLPGQRLVAKLYRSEEHTSELQSLMRTSYAVFCLKKKKT